MQIILLSALSCGMRDIHTSISLDHHSIVLIYIQDYSILYIGTICSQMFTSYCHFTSAYIIIVTDTNISEYRNSFAEKLSQQRKKNL